MESEKERDIGRQAEAQMRERTERAKYWEEKAAEKRREEREEIDQDNKKLQLLLKDEKTNGNS